MVIGGMVAMALIALTVLVLVLVGMALASITGVLLYAGIVTAWLVVRASRHQQSGRRTVSALLAQDERQMAKGARDAGASIAAILIGLILTIIASLLLRGLDLPIIARLSLPPVIGATVGLGGYALVRRWVAPLSDEEWPPAREIKAQISRIRRKSSYLSREAGAVGGVFGNLDRQANEMSRRARELADRVFELRRVARDVKRDAEQASNQRPSQAASDGTQARLAELLARNRRAQQRCLAQLTRIERLIDLARLEISCPDHETPERDPEEVAHEFARELEAARQALEEVHRQVEL